MASLITPILRNITVRYLEITTFPYEFFGKVFYQWLYFVIHVIISRKKNSSNRTLIDSGKWCMSRDARVSNTTDTYLLRILIQLYALSVLFRKKTLPSLEIQIFT